MDAVGTPAAASGDAAEPSFVRDGTLRLRNSQRDGIGQLRELGQLLG